MSAIIYQLPPRQELTWRPIAEALRTDLIERYGSEELAEAVEARCRSVFERLFPSHELIPAGATEDDVRNIITEMIGRFIYELSLMATDLELQKQQGDEA